MEAYYFSCGRLHLAGAGPAFRGHRSGWRMHFAAQQYPCGSGCAGAIAICAGARKIEPVSASLSPAGPRASTSARRGALLPALASLALVLLPPCARAEAQEPVAAVWKERELHFSDRSFMAVQPCRVLQNRIARVLNALGARQDLQVTLTNCDARVASPTVVAGDHAGWPQNSTGSAPGGWPMTSSSDGANGPPNPSESRPSAYWRTEPRQAVEVKVRHVDTGRNDAGGDRRTEDEPEAPRVDRARHGRPAAAFRWTQSHSLRSGRS